MKMKFKGPSYRRLVEVRESINNNGIEETSYPDYYVTGDLLVNKKTLYTRKLFLTGYNKSIREKIVDRYLSEKDKEYELDDSNLCECMKELLHNDKKGNFTEENLYARPVYTGDMVYIMLYNEHNNIKILDCCPVCGKKFSTLMLKEVKHKVNKKKYIL